MQTDILHIQILTEEFAKRSERNNRYSMRAFAKHLEMHPSALSRILAGKQKMSSSAAIVVAKKLSLDRDKSRQFLQSILEEHRQLERVELGEALDLPELKIQPQKIDEANYAIIARLVCLATRELMLTENFESDPQWIARRLGATPETIRECIRALTEVGLAEEVDGKLAPKERHLTAVDTEESSAIRVRLQKEIVQRALQSLEKDPFHQRAHYGMTMAINPERIPAANKMILEFMETLCDYLEVDPRKEVYQLSVQLFPLTEIKSEKEGMQ